MPKQYKTYILHGALSITEGEELHTFKLILGVFSSKKKCQDYLKDLTKANICNLFKAYLPHIPSYAYVTHFKYNPSPLYSKFATFRFEILAPNKRTYFYSGFMTTDEYVQNGLITGADDDDLMANP